MLLADPRTLSSLPRPSRGLSLPEVPGRRSPSLVLGGLEFGNVGKALSWAKTGVTAIFCILAFSAAFHSSMLIFLEP